MIFFTCEYTHSCYNYMCKSFCLHCCVDHVYCLYIIMCLHPPAATSCFYDHGSVHYSGADATTCDNSKLNPFMLALEKGQKAVAVFMVKTLKGDDCLGRGGETIGWALEKNLSLFFEVWQAFYTHLHHLY